MNKENKGKRLVKDTIIFAIGSLGTKVIQFVMMPLYTNYMTSAEYGVSNLIFTIVQLLLPIVSLNIFDAVLRFGMSKTEKSANVLKTALKIVVLDLFLIIILIPIINLYKPLNEWTYYLVVYLFLNILNSTIMNYLKVKNKNLLYAIISLIQTFVLASTNVLLIAHWKMGVDGYMLSSIIAMATSCILGTICGNVISDIRRAHFDKKLLFQMLRYSIPLIFNAIAWWLISSSDKIMIEIMCGSALLGIYSVAAKIPALINVFISIFQQSWGLSAIREMETSNDMRFYSVIFEIYSFIIFGASLLTIIFIRPFMNIYIGKDFLDSVQFVPFLIYSSIFSAISTFAGSLYTAMKDTKKIMNTTLLAGILNIIINYFGIKYLGVMGAVIGTVVAYFLIANIRMFDLYRRIEFEFKKWKYLGNCLILFLISFLVTYGMESIVIDFVIIISFGLINRSSIVKLKLLKRESKDGIKKDY